MKHHASPMMIVLGGSYLMKHHASPMMIVLGGSSNQNHALVEKVNDIWTTDSLSGLSYHKQ